MKVRIFTKYDVPLIEYYLGQKGEEDYQRIPDLNDHIEVDGERYLIVDRTFRPQANEVVLQAWKPLLDEPFEEESGEP